MAGSETNCCTTQRPHVAAVRILASGSVMVPCISGYANIILANLEQHHGWVRGGMVVDTKRR